MQWLRRFPEAEAEVIERRAGRLLLHERHVESRVEPTRRRAQNAADEVREPAAIAVELQMDLALAVALHDQHGRLQIGRAHV